MHNILHRTILQVFFINNLDDYELSSGSGSGK